MPPSTGNATTAPTPTGHDVQQPDHRQRTPDPVAAARARHEAATVRGLWPDADDCALGLVAPYRTA